jgi:hypothetical protein
VYAANRAAQDAKESAELAARRAATARRDAARRSMLIAAGLQHRPPSYWDAYKLGPEFRAIFDGDWSGAATHWEFGNLFARTIRAYSNRCRALIPKGSPYQVQKTVTRDRFGNVWEPEGGDTTFIPRAFFAPYAWWESNDPQALVVAPPGLEVRSVEGLMGMLAAMFADPTRVLGDGAVLIAFQTSMREDMALLFADGCASPLVKQFMENLRRLALRQPTLQAELAPRSLPAIDGWLPRIGARCEQHERERGAELLRDWCPCLEREFGRQYTLGEQWRALEDYHRFFDEVAGFKLAADGRPVWARYTPADACRKR